jgi:glycosyltransferase involved in cell wall biosynthesis
VAGVVRPQPRIAVLTASIPERHELLAECIASVSAQTLKPVQHVIGIDHERAGCVPTMNRMLKSVDADWVALLADDDLMYPHHLETLHAHTDEGDIVYSWCDVEGRNWNPNTPFDADRLRQANYIPSTSLIRKSLIDKLGGWDADAAHGWEDWNFWLRALDVKARFVCVSEITWRYRFMGDNISYRA